MTYTPDEDFANFLTKFGQPFAAKAADEAVLQKYRSILPDQLLTYWRQYGFCGFADGLFWITNPDDYEDILPDWLPEAEQARHKHYVIARTGWGELLVWEPGINTPSIRISVSSVWKKMFPEKLPKDAAIKKCACFFPCKNRNILTGQTIKTARCSNVP